MVRLRRDPEERAAAFLFSDNTWIPCFFGVSFGQLLDKTVMAPVWVSFPLQNQSLPLLGPPCPCVVFLEPSKHAVLT